MQIDGGEMQGPIALYIHLPLSRARSPPAASGCTAAIPMSVCLSAAGLGCMLLPSPALSPVSSQTKVGDAFFRSQRQLVSSFPGTITLLLRTNVDICRERKKSIPGSANWKATLFLFDDSVNSSGIPPEIKA